MSRSRIAVFTAALAAAAALTGGTAAHASTAGNAYGAAPAAAGQRVVVGHYSPDFGCVPYGSPQLRANGGCPN